jgi:probable rRNA maturation factor
MARDRSASPLRLSVQYATARPAPTRDRVRRWVRAAIAVLDGPDRSYALTVRFVDEDEARTLNRTYRGRDYATNVLTFPYSNDEGRVEGDVVVCMPVVEAEARQQQKDAMTHGAHLVVHGVLHAAGHDHESPREAEAMEAIERAVLARFRIADPYAVRA